MDYCYYFVHILQQSLWYHHLQNVLNLDINFGFLGIFDSTKHQPYHDFIQDKTFFWKRGFRQGNQKDEVGHEQDSCTLRKTDYNRSNGKVVFSKAVALFNNFHPI